VEHKCDAALVVIALRERTARACVRPIATAHPGFVLAPIVIGPGTIPPPGGPGAGQVSEPGGNPTRGGVRALIPRDQALRGVLATQRPAIPIRRTRRTIRLPAAQHHLKPLPLDRGQVLHQPAECGRRRHVPLPDLLIGQPGQLAP
jgi:hypothetical protein